MNLRLKIFLAYSYFLAKGMVRKFVRGGVFEGALKIFGAEREVIKKFAAKASKLGEL